jgi:glycosyltransferase involved in cell wall biosynthesis
VLTDGLVTNLLLERRPYLFRVVFRNLFSGTRAGESISDRGSVFSFREAHYDRVLDLTSHWCLQPMKILSIIHYPMFIGPHNSNMQVIPRLREQGIETIVVLPDQPGSAAERLRFEGIEVVTLPLGRVRARTSLRIQTRFLVGLAPQVQALRRIIRERAIDVVWLNAMVHPHGAIAARLERIPIVWQLIDEFPPMWLRHAMMPIVLRSAACVMTTGMHTARVHPGAAKIGDRLIPFFPPVDTSRFCADPATRAQARTALGFAPDEIVIGNVANLAPYKDHVTFVRAAAELRRTQPHARFAVLGCQFPQYPAYAESVKAEATRLGFRIGRDLIIRDPGARVAELAQAFDVFWLTSNSNEGAPTVLCEAMSLGIPVVATAIASVPEMVRDGSSGFVVPVRNPGAIAAVTAKILANPTLRAAISAEARRTAVELFNVQVCAELHARAFRMAVHDRRSGRRTKA